MHRTFQQTRLKLKVPAHRELLPTSSADGIGIAIMNVDLLFRTIAGVFLVASGIGMSKPAIAIAAEVRFVEVKEKTVRIGLPRLDTEVGLVGVGCFEESIGEQSRLFRGSADGQVIAVDRISKTGRDRLYDRFVLVDSSGQAMGHGRYPDRLKSLPASGSAIAWPESIKGLQEISNWDDAAELGVAHVTLNISITSLIQRQGTDPDSPPDMQHVVDGRTYVLNENRVRAIDQAVQAATKLGINTIAIILCNAQGQLNHENPLLHPSAKLSDAPNGIVAVNTTTAEAERRYRAVMGFLGRRYSRSDSKYGRIGGYIIGNEVQSHWFWHNMGEQSPAAVVRQYADQLRLSYYALREHTPEPKVFISMDHHWSANYGDDPLRTLSGRELLDRLSKNICQRGDFPWHVAWHPYPQNHFKPDFWNDSDAVYSMDTPKITFKNVEILLDYLQQESLLVDGKPRRVILSEQGFHAGDGETNERLQAASFAASFVQISALDGIDAFILHRHVDHHREGGLKFGLRQQNATQQPARKRLIYHTYAAAGTEEQEAAFQFALPIVGIRGWPELRPKLAHFPEHGDKFPDVSNGKNGKHSQEADR